MTLDNSIVVLESIELARRRGLDRLRSAVEGVREVWPAVLASTLTTVLVFVPVMFIEQEAGQLYSDIAIAISASILMSNLHAIFRSLTTSSMSVGPLLEQANRLLASRDEGIGTNAEGLTSPLIQQLRNAAHGIGVFGRESRWH